MPYVTVAVEIGDQRLNGREIGHLEVRQAVGAHAHLALAFAPTSGMRASAAAHAARPDQSVSGRTSAAAALLYAPVRVLFVDDAGTAHIAFQGRVAAVRSVQRPRAGRQVLVSAWSDSAAFSTHAVVRRWPQHTLAQVAGVLGIRVEGVPDATGEALNLVQDGVADWAFLARLASQAGLQLVPDWPRTDGSADDQNGTSGSASGDAPVAVVRAGFSSLEHVLVHGRDLLAFAVAAREVEPDVAGAMSETAIKHDHRFRNTRHSPEWFAGAAPFRRVVDERRDRPGSVGAGLSHGTAGGAARDVGLGGPGEGTLVSDAGLGPVGRASGRWAAGTRLQLASERRSGGAVWTTGRSTCPALRAGDRVYVAVGGSGTEAGDVWAEAMPEAAGNYGVAALVHRWDGALYENLFVATPWAGYHPHPDLLAADAAELDDTWAGESVLGPALGRAGGVSGAWGLRGPHAGTMHGSDAADDPEGHEAALFAAGSLGYALLALGVPSAAVAGHAPGTEGGVPGGGAAIPRGVHAGLVSAMVTANVDPRGWGRVRIRFAWQGPEEAHAWARVAAPAAGKGRGIGTLPEVGDEVLVGFQGGDPEHPVVVGSVWNGVDVAAHRPGLQHWVTAAGNAHVLVDDKGAERQELHTPGGRTRFEMTHAGPNSGPAVMAYSAGDIVLECEKTLHIRAGAVRIEVAGAVETHAGGGYTVKVQGALTVTADGALGIAGSGAVTVRAGGVLHAHGGGSHRLTGPTVEVNNPGARPPAVQAQLGQALASVAAARAIPVLGPGVSTEDRRVRIQPERVEREAPRAWVAAQVLLDGKPASGVAFRVRLPSGDEQTLRTDSQGMLYVDGVRPGRAVITPTDRAWPPPPPPLPYDEPYEPDVEEYDA